MIVDYRDLVMNYLRYYDLYVGDSSSQHSKNCKNNLLLLGGGPTGGINDNLDDPEKKVQY